MVILALLSPLSLSLDLPKPKKVATPRAERSTAEGTTEVQNLLFYKQFETRLQELKQIWNEIRSNVPKEVPTEKLGTCNMYCNWQL